MEKERGRKEGRKKLKDLANADSNLRGEGARGDRADKQLWKMSLVRNCKEIS